MSHGKSNLNIEVLDAADRFAYLESYDLRLFGLSTEGSNITLGYVSELHNLENNAFLGLTSLIAQSVQLLGYITYIDQ